MTPTESRDAKTEERLDLYRVGESPPTGHVPENMHAWVIRQETYGEPETSFKLEVVNVPEVGDDEVLVEVMAAGVNYNGVWAARGHPVDTIRHRLRRGEKDAFQICGTDASGIVRRVGRKVTDLKVGDEVVAYGGQWDADCPHVLAGGDPVASPTYQVWGYETHWGSFAQYCRVQAHQCFAKPERLSWEAAACFLASGSAAYRMLHRWDGNTVKPDDVVLVWGGAGGLGSMAIQLIRLAGGLPVVVVSSGDRAEFCHRLGAVGCVDRNDFDHWGPLPDLSDHKAYETWQRGVKRPGKTGAVAFRRAIWKAVGKRRNPSIVFEHPGEDTLATSLFVCEPRGMVVICAGTTGYLATLDLRYLWMQQKRLQGSHAGDDEDAGRFTEMVSEGQIDPCLSLTYPWEQLPQAHQLMADNRHPPGNMAVRVGATEPSEAAG